VRQLPRKAKRRPKAGRRPTGRRGRRAQSSSPSESLLEFELEFELELLLEFELELELLFELELELELLLLLLLEFELLLELELLFEFEFELLLELPSSSISKIFLRKLWNPSSATAGAAANEVATKATVATLAKVFIGGVLPFQKQPSVTAQG
jgi:hypothetical protein